jgi:hypothetical protein
VYLGIISKHVNVSETRMDCDRDSFGGSIINRLDCDHINMKLSSVLLEDSNFVYRSARPMWTGARDRRAAAESHATHRLRGRV